MERLLCSIITDISYIGGLNNRPTLRKCFLINGRGSCMIWLLKRLGYLVCTLVFCSNLLHLRKVAFFKNMICNLNKLNKLLFIYNIFVFILFSMKYVTFSQWSKNARVLTEGWLSKIHIPCERGPYSHIKKQRIFQICRGKFWTIFRENLGRVPPCPSTWHKHQKER